MKRILLGTTALATAGLISGAAFAADPINIKVGGYYRTAFGVLDTDTGTIRSHGINNDVEIHFRGSTKLDNGIEVGVMVELEAETSGDQIDEHHVYFRGTFGELRIGKEDDVRKLFANTAPGGPSNFGVNSPFFTAGVSTTTTTSNMENDSTKLIYFTPSFSGFRVGASYAPDNGSTSAGIRAAENSGNVNSESWSIAASYSGKFGDFTVAADVGYTAADPEGTTAATGSNRDPSIVRGGLVLGYGAFKVGGSIERNKELSGTATADNDSVQWDIGVSYGTGPWTVGIGYIKGEYEANLCSVTTASLGDCEHQAIVAGVLYNLGGGVAVDAAIEYSEDDGRSLTTTSGTTTRRAKEETIAFMIGTRVTF